MATREDIDVKRLIREGDKLFAARGSLLSLWQEIAENFYVERADFTRERDWGEDFAAHLSSSYPLMVRRELGNQLGGILRPRAQEWFFGTVDKPERLNRTGKEWLEWATGKQRKVMYNRLSNFVRATRQADHDWSSFGQGVLGYGLDFKTITMLYEHWHLRDCAWSERYNGQIGCLHRVWRPSADQLLQLFDEPEKRGEDCSVHQKVRDMLAQENGQGIVTCRHVALLAADYGIRSRLPYVHIWIDIENEHVMRVTERRTFGYVVPRWVTISGSQYAYSGATVIALPDARLIQSMSLTLLEAGEMAVRPPMIAVKEVIRGDVALYPGGITWADAEYDERLGEVLRPITQDKGALPWGMEMEQDKRQMLSQAFYLNKLSMPSASTNREMTAYEVAQLVQQYIREALPLFEPIEQEYSAPLCEGTFEELLNGTDCFGAYRDIPQSVRGQDVTFTYESPLNRAIERMKGQQLAEGQSIVASAMQIDPSVVSTLDMRIGVRDALEGVGIPAKWMRDEQAVEQMAQQMQAKQAQAQQMQMAQAGADIAATAGAAERDLASAG